MEASFTQGSENEVSHLQAGKTSATHIAHRYTTSILSDVHNLSAFCTYKPTNYKGDPQYARVGLEEEYTLLILMLFYVCPYFILAFL